VMGNIHEQSLRDIWFGPAYRELRQYLKKTSQPVGKIISQGELQAMRRNLDDNRFAYCKSCLVRWNEAGS